MPDPVSEADRKAIDEAFPSDVDVVYVVYTGTFSNKDKTDQGIAGAVCTRVVEQDAKEIAQLLNDAQEGVLFLKWAASVCFPKVRGGRQELEEAINTDAVREAWERIAAPNRKELYRVAKLKIQNEADVRKFNDELKK